MSAWKPNYIVLNDDPILLNKDIKKYDPEMYIACSTANSWIEALVESIIDDPDLEFIEL